ncbi:cold shock domain-containing protein [Streptomyces exfoliatus]|uniref:cold shock domain-containing protein n=1 Tax=Streptomyces exfoliatus TaxID=1905 RepID=UPI000D128A48
MCCAAGTGAIASASRTVWAINSSGFRELLEGQTVTIDVIQGQKGAAATPRFR